MTLACVRLLSRPSWSFMLSVKLGEVCFAFSRSTLAIYKSNRTNIQSIIDFKNYFVCCSYKVRSIVHVACYLEVSMLYILVLSSS